MVNKNGFKVVLCGLAIWLSISLGYASKNCSNAAEVDAAEQALIAEDEKLTEAQINLGQKEQELEALGITALKEALDEKKDALAAYKAEREAAKSSKEEGEADIEEALEALADPDISAADKEYYEGLLELAIATVNAATDVLGTITDEVIAAAALAVKTATDLLLIAEQKAQPLITEINRLTQEVERLVNSIDILKQAWEFAKSVCKGIFD